MATVGLLGATGYTGRLVAAELARRGVEHRLGGRNPERLAALPKDPLARTHVVDVSQSGQLDAFMDGIDVVVTCVGPFTRYGMPVVEAAVRNGVPYVDSTGEPDFMRQVYDRFDTAPVSVVPAGGFDYVPGDLAAAVAAASVPGGVREITVAYDLRGIVPTRGTARSAVEAAGTASVRPRTRRVRFPDGERTTVEIPWGEQLTVPRHLHGVDVRSTLAVPALAVPLAAPLVPLFRLARPVAAFAVDRMPEGPSLAVRRAARFRIVAEARDTDGGVATVVCDGRDVYGLTARFLVALAGELAERRGPAGARAPAEVVHPREFLDAVSTHDEHGAFSWRTI